ncbi:MAG: MarR family transcriptional regulator [Alphaproteobacteria bacterium]|nr:MarR family transcriptional regulator [Alphaproteobacteria bacterium]
MPPLPRNRRKPSSRERAEIYRGVLEELIGYHLRRGQVAVFQDFAATMDGIDLTPGQFGVLALIQANPGLSQSALGQAMGIDRSSVVAVIDRLEDRGLVQRAAAANDRRSYALRLSTDGMRQFAGALKRVYAHEKHIARRLTVTERAQLLALLRRVG